METKKTMEALGEWDEQIDRVSAKGVNLTEEKSTDSREESQTAFHLWGGEQLRHPGQDKLRCVLLAGWHRWDWKSLILVFRWHHGLQSKIFSSGTGEMDLKPRKTDPLFKDSGMSSLAGRGSGDGQPGWALDSCSPTKLQHASSASGQEWALSPHSLIAWLCDLTLGRRRVWVLPHLTLELRKTAYPFDNSASSSAKWVMEESLHIRLVLLNYLLLTMLGLCCCADFFSSCGECGLLYWGVWLLIVVASLIAEHRL